MLATIIRQNICLTIQSNSDICFPCPMPTTSPFCLSQLPTAGPSNHDHLPIPSLLIWEDKPTPLLGYLLFLRSHLWNQRLISDPRSEKTQTEPRCWGTRGLEWKWQPQCWFPEGRVTDHVCPSQPVHTRGSLGIVIMKENLGFSLLRQQRQDYTPKPCIQEWGDKGAQTGKGLTRSEAKKLGAEQQYKMWYLLSGQAVQGSHCDLTRKDQRLVFTCCEHPALGQVWQSCGVCSGCILVCNKMLPNLKHHHFIIATTIRRCTKSHFPWFWGWTGLRWGALAFGLSSGYSHMVSSLIHPKGLFTYLAVDVGCYLGS